MRDACSGVVVANVQSLQAVPYLNAARRLRVPAVGYVASGDHTVGKGIVSPHVDRYVVQNGVMRDDLVRHHGIAAGRVVVTGWPQSDVFAHRRPRAGYQALLEGLGLDPLRRAVLIPGNTPTNTPYEGRFVERLVAWSGSLPPRRASAAPVQTASPRSRVARTLRLGAHSRGRRGAGAVLHRHRGARDPPAARRLRRLQCGHHPPRRTRRTTDLRSASSTTRVAGRRAARSTQRHRQALRGGHRVKRVRPRERVRCGGRGNRALPGDQTSLRTSGSASHERSWRKWTDGRRSAWSTRSWRRSGRTRPRSEQPGQPEEDERRCDRQHEVEVGEEAEGVQSTTANAASESATSTRPAARPAHGDGDEAERGSRSTAAGTSERAGRAGGRAARCRCDRESGEELVDVRVIWSKRARSPGGRTRSATRVGDVQTCRMLWSGVEIQTTWPAGIGWPSVGSGSFFPSITTVAAVSTGLRAARGRRDRGTAPFELVPDRARTPRRIRAGVRADPFDARAAEHAVVVVPAEDLVGEEVQVLVDAEAAPARRARRG